MTLEEYRASYSIWAVLASPMIISADLRTLAAEHPACLAMLKNKELIAVSQDSLGEPGRLIRQKTNTTDPSPAAVRSTNIIEQVFVRPLESSKHDDVGSTVALVLFNRAETASNISVTWAELGLSDSGTYAV